MTRPALDTVAARLRGWTRRLWGALSGRRRDDDLRRELEAHIAFAEDELVRQGHAPEEAARMARALAGGRVQALEALRAQRGLPWLTSSWLDIKLGLRLLARNRGLTIVGGLAMTVVIAIATVVFAAFDILLWSPLPLDEGNRVVAIQMWDREAGARVGTPWEDIERWRADLHSIEEVGAFRTTRRNVIAPDDSIELASVAEMSPSGFRLARVSPILGRALTDADATPGAPPAVVIGHDVWQRRFGGAWDVIGRDLRLGNDVHTIVGVMPEGFEFPFNFEYWAPLRPMTGDVLPTTGPEGVVFGRLADGVTMAQAHAEVAALGRLPSSADTPDTLAAVSPRVVAYTFAFTGDFENGELGMIWSMASLLAVLLLLPPCANIAILNYARTVTRQQEFAARHALGGSRARIVTQLFIESLVLAAAAGAAALLLLRVATTIMSTRLNDIPGGPPFWMTLDISWRTLLFVGALVVIGAALSGLVPALQATGRLSRLGAGALAGRTSLNLGGTWTSLVIAQVAFSVAALPLAAQLAWGTLRTGVVGPGFAAEEYATVRVSLEQPEPSLVSARQQELSQRLIAEPGVAGVATALRAPGEEPWVFVEVEGRDAPAETLNGQLPGVRARFNVVDADFFDVYAVPQLAGGRFTQDGVAADAVVINRNFAETIAPGGNALGHRFRYVRAMEGGGLSFDPERWYQVAGVVGNLPVTTAHNVAYHLASPGQLHPLLLQLHMRGDTRGLAERVRTIAASVDATLHVDEVRTLDAIYREHRFGDNVGAIVIVAITGSVLLLSAAGLYALMAFTVAQRRREIGIRSALGAQPRQLLSAVFRRAFIQLAAASALGVLAAWLVGQYVPIDQIGGLPIPGVLPGAVAFMLSIGALAALGPARRGLRIAPTEALRGDQRGLP